MLKHATLHRMVMDKHVCPWGQKSLYLLKREGYTVDDRHLTTREETEAFKAEHGVKSTPQTFIDGKRIGGYEDLLRFFGKPVPDPKTASYKPVIAVFAMTALMALALNSRFEMTIGDEPGFYVVQTLETFIALSMCVLALLKLQNVESFATMFLGYDLLARKWLPYSYIYPFAEAAAGALMLAGVLTWFSAPLALFIGTVGAVSVFYAVYVQKRDIKCACVGGSSNVPLGFVSLTENLMMIAMAVWMLIAPAFDLGH